MQFSSCSLHFVRLASLRGIGFDVFRQNLMPLNVCADVAESVSIIHRLPADKCSLFSSVVYSLK